MQTHHRDLSLRLLHILFERAHEVLLLLARLEATMTKLACGVDKLEVNMLHVPFLEVRQQRLAQGDNTFLGPNTAAPDHEAVLLHLTIVSEASHGRDTLFCDIKLGGGVVLHLLVSLFVESLANTVDLLVDLRAVVLAFLTSTSHSVRHTGRVPRSDTGDFTQTLVCLTL